MLVSTDNIVRPIISGFPSANSTVEGMQRKKMLFQTDNTTSLKELPTPAHMPTHKDTHPLFTRIEKVAPPPAASYLPLVSEEEEV